MSVLILAQGSIDDAYNTLMDLAYAGPATVSPGLAHQITTFFCFDVNHKPQSKTHGLQYLFRWAAVMNVRNFNRRYAHNRGFLSSNHQYIPKRVSARPVTLRRLTQTLKTMQCLDHNIMDNYNTGKDYKTFCDWTDTLRRAIVESLTEYDTAAWG